MNSAIGGVVWGELSVRERDALVAERVMGWTKRGGRAGFWTDPADPGAFYGAGYTHDGSDYDFRDFAPSTEIADAWGVVEKLRAVDGHMDIELHMYDNATDQETFESSEKAAVWCELLSPISLHAEAWGDTAPEAICIASLRACGVEVVTDG